MPTFVQVSRPGMGSYTDELKNLPNILQGEFEQKDVGAKVSFEFVAMTQEEFDSLPEFTGW